ncbi:cardioacceleratory peptide receptor-like, partial [Saccoglossus kowalevskii]
YTIYQKHTSIWTPSVIQRVVTICVIMLLTIVGNSLIITVLSCTKGTRRSSRVNIFILNLAVGDLFVCFVTMATEILFVAFGEWVFGEVMCKLIVYGQIVTLASTTFILTVMSFDRFQAICRPLSFSGSLSRAKKMLIGAWIMAFIFALPQLFIFVLVEKSQDDGDVRYYCKSNGYTAEWQRKVYFTWMTCYILVIPASIVSYCYIRIVFVVCSQGKDSVVSSKRSFRGKHRTKVTDNFAKSRHVDMKKIERSKIKTIKMTLCIILAFVTCWSPYFIVTLQQIYGNAEDIPEVSFVIAETMALANSAINPILYGCFNLKIQRTVITMCCPGRIKYKNTLRSGFTTTEQSYMSEDGHSRRVNLRGSDVQELSAGYTPVRTSPAMGARGGFPKTKSVEHVDYRVSCM